MAYKFISSVDQLLQQISDNNREAIYVGGDIVYITTDKEALNQVAGSSDDFVIQPPRLAAKPRAFESKRAHLYLCIQREAIKYLADYRGDVFFLADHYLHFGLSQREDCIVIGGGLTVHGALNLEIYVFTKSRLVETQERNVDNSGYSLDLTLGELVANYPEHNILWCSPLGAPPISDVSNLDRFKEVQDQPLLSPVRKKVYAKQQKTEESLGLPRAAFVAATGVALFCAVVALRWTAITSERSEYKEEIRGYEAVYSNSAHSLDLLRHRKSFIDQTPAHVSRIDMLNHLLSQVARLEGVVIEKVTVYAPDDADALQTTVGAVSAISATLDFRVEILVPVMEGNSARDQAEPVLSQLNHTTGMSFELTDHAAVSKKSGSSSVNYWSYKLSGTVAKTATEGEDYAQQ